MDDKTLLELAAKAIGHRANFNLANACQLWTKNMRYVRFWNPLTDDDDALRLAVKLNLLVDCASQRARPLPDDLGWFGGEAGESDEAATRRAIVCAAAELGKSLP